MHYRNSTEQGARSARKVVRHMLSHYFRPTHGRDDDDDDDDDGDEDREAHVLAAWRRSAVVCAHDDCGLTCL